MYDLIPLIMIILILNIMSTNKRPVVFIRPETDTECPTYRKVFKNG